jgi:hypothetical protein
MLEGAILGPEQLRRIGRGREIASVRTLSWKHTKESHINMKVGNNL